MELIDTIYYFWLITYLGRWERTEVIDAYMLSLGLTELTIILVSRMMCNLLQYRKMKGFFSLFSSRPLNNNASQVQFIYFCYNVRPEHEKSFADIVFVGVISILYPWKPSLIAKFMGPTWVPHGSDRAQVGSMLATWALLFGVMFGHSLQVSNLHVLIFFVVNLKLYLDISPLSLHWQAINNHGTSLLLPEYGGFSTTRATKAFKRRWWSLER